METFQSIIWFIPITTVKNKQLQADLQTEVLPQGLPSLIGPENLSGSLGFYQFPEMPLGMSSDLMIPQAIDLIIALLLVLLLLCFMYVACIPSELRNIAHCVNSGGDYKHNQTTTHTGLLTWCSWLVWFLLKACGWGKISSAEKTNTISFISSEYKNHMYFE